MITFPRLGWISYNFRRLNATTRIRFAAPLLSVLCGTRRDRGLRSDGQHGGILIHQIHSQKKSAAFDEAFRPFGVITQMPLGVDGRGPGVLFLWQKTVIYQLVDSQDLRCAEFEAPLLTLLRVAPLFLTAYFLDTAGFKR